MISRETIISILLLCAIQSILGITLNSQLPLRIPQRYSYKRAILSPVTQEKVHFENQRSILSGRMSSELVKEISEYVYNLLRGKQEISDDIGSHSQYFKQKSTKDNSVDYKDYVDIMDDRVPKKNDRSYGLVKPVAFVKQYRSQSRTQTTKSRYRTGVSKRFTQSVPTVVKRRSFSRFRRLGQ